MIIPESLLTFLKEGDCFCLVSHQDPDGDAVASSVVLGSLLSRLGKEVLLCSPGPWNRQEIEEYRDLFMDHLPEDFIKKSPRLIALDSSTPERLGDFEKYIYSFPCAMIDHHSSGEHFGGFRYIDPALPSATSLVYKISKALGMDLTREEAWMLLFGLCTDTGFFKHLEGNSSFALSMAADLSSQEISLKEIHTKIYSDKTLESRILLGKTLESTEPLFGGKILFTYETLSDYKTFGSAARDSDRVYELLQGVRDCAGVVFFRQEGENTVSLGLRSNHGLDMGTLARRYGGGGHEKAASFQFSGKTEEIREILIRELEELLQGKHNQQIT